LWANVNKKGGKRLGRFVKFERFVRFGSKGSKGSKSSMGSKGWEISSADVCVFNNHQIRKILCWNKFHFLILYF